MDVRRLQMEVGNLTAVVKPLVDYLVPPAEEGAMAENGAPPPTTFLERLLMALKCHFHPLTTLNNKGKL